LAGFYPLRLGVVLGERLTPKRRRILSPRGRENGGPGGQSPHGGGCGGCPPTKPKRGSELPLLATPPRVGPKTPANPKPTGVGKGGSRGAKPPWRGVWGVSPHKNKRGNELPTLATPPRVGPNTLANPQPTGVGKGGSRGAKPPWRGVWGVSPHKTKKRGRVAHISNPATSGTQNAGKPSAYGGGQRGWRGRSPIPGGLVDVPPKTKRGGELPTLATCPRVGPKTLANPQPTRVGKTGVQGGKAPLARGLGDVPPRTLKGVSCPH